MFYSKSLRNFLNRWPGKRIFGVYRFLPVFFVVGASIEWVMINARIAPGRETFYDVYRRKQSEQLYTEKLAKAAKESQNV